MVAARREERVSWANLLFAVSSLIGAWAIIGVRPSSTAAVPTSAGFPGGTHCGPGSRSC